MNELVLLPRIPASTFQASLLSHQKYAVKLCNVGNPDFRQDPSRPLYGTECGWAVANTLQGCVEACRQYQIEYDLGGGNWSGGQIFDIATRKQIARVSYNGRVWDMNDQPMDEI